jgi:hypothetical protein
MKNWFFWGTKAFVFESNVENSIKENFQTDENSQNGNDVTRFVILTD